MTIRILLLIGIMIGTTVSSWVVAVRMRKRMRRSLGRRVTDLELVSLKHWVRVNEVEERTSEHKPVHPR